MVRAVHPHVGEIRGDAQDARQGRAAHHAIRGPVCLEQREDLLIMPARVTELHRDPDPAGNLPEKIIQPRVITCLRRRELDEQHRPLVAELMPARRDALHPRLRCAEFPAVGKPPRRLDRQPEAGRQPAPPAAERRRPGPPVETAVELGRAERGRVPGQPVTGREPGRIQLRLPVAIAPARRPDHHRQCAPHSDSERK